MTNAVRDSPVLGYKPDPFSQRYLPRVFNPWERYWKGERIETHSWNVMADDETGIRLFSSTEKDNTSSIPRIKMQFLIFYSKEKIDSANGLGFTYLYLCRKSAHWHSSIFKIGTVGKPAILEEMENMQNVKSSGCSSGNKTRTDCYSSKKRFHDSVM